MRIQGDPQRLFMPVSHSSRENSDQVRISLRLGNQQDSMIFSSLGRQLAAKLVIRNDGVTSTNRENSVKSLSDPQMRMMGRTMGEVKEILEGMKELAEKAQDSTLSWDDRIDMQIEMADLQLALYEKTYGMSMWLAKPDQTGSFYDEKVTEQHERIVEYLEEMRSGGTSSLERGFTVKDLYDSSGEKRGIMTSYSKALFELDDNGYLKMKDEAFDALPMDHKSSLDITLDHYANAGWLYSEDNSKEQVNKLSLSLLDSGNAADAIEKIEEQLTGLNEIEAAFDKLASVDPTVIYQYGDADSLQTGLFQTQLGLMRYTHAPDGSENLHDVRLTETRDPVGSFFAKLEELFKDDIYSSLGFGDFYKGTMQAKGVNLEQLALIKEAQEEMSKIFSAISAARKLPGMQELSPDNSEFFRLV